MTDDLSKRDSDKKKKNPVCWEKNFITKKLLLSCLKLESYNLRPKADLLYPYVLKPVDIIIERQCKATAI